ncbi:macrophage mannose receptor 1-like [Crotalus adamanteus]|uniref:Macrophage mannose receptor 1-like n=1 Tax=Crotalus adamanteus TaxID=8729 RepID=A0AAW1BQL3_CROAD
MSAPFHPSSNGLAERMVRTTKDALKKLTYGNYHHRLADFLLAHCTTPYTATGKSPAELRWSRCLITKLDRLHPDRVASQVSQPGPARRLQVGDPVWARNYGPGHLWITAVVCKVSGPFVI